MTNEIRRDLEKRIDKRLRDWLHDAVQLYEIAEIPMGETMLDVSSVLMMVLTVVLSCSGATPEDIGAGVGEAMEKAVAYKRRMDVAKSES